MKIKTLSRDMVKLRLHRRLECKLHATLFRQKVARTCTRVASFVLSRFLHNLRQLRHRRWLYSERCLHGIEPQFSNRTTSHAPRS